MSTTGGGRTARGRGQTAGEGAGSARHGGALRSPEPAPAVCAAADGPGHPLSQVGEPQTPHYSTRVRDLKHKTKGHSYRTQTGACLRGGGWATGGTGAGKQKRRVRRSPRDGGETRPARPHALGAAGSDSAASGARPSTYLLETRRRVRSARARGARLPTPAVRPQTGVQSGRKPSSPGEQDAPAEPEFGRD